MYDGCKAMINVFMKGNGCKITVGRGSLIDESTSIVLMGQGNRVEIGEECMFAEKVEIWASDTHLITDLQGNPLNPSGRHRQACMARQRGKRDERRNNRRTYNRRLRKHRNKRPPPSLHRGR